MSSKPIRSKRSPLIATLRSLAALAMVASPLGHAAAATLDVKDFGAKGDGHSDDARAINAAIAAASAGGDTVEFPRGTYVSTSIHLRSSVTLLLDAGATIQAA